MCLIGRRSGWRGSVGGEHRRRVSAAQASESSFEVEAIWHHVFRIILVHAFPAMAGTPGVVGHLPALSGAVPERARLLVAG